MTIPNTLIKKLLQNRLLSHPYVLWSALFLGMALLLTWPLALHLTTHIPGFGGDGLIFLWDMWWTKYSLFNLHQHPLHCDYLLAPQGVSLTFHTLILLPSLLSIPLQGLFGLITAHNLLFFAGFILTGLGMIRFFRETAIRFPANLVGALLFTFSPYVLARATGHLNLFFTWPIPWAMTFFWRLRRHGRWQDAFWLGAVLGLSLMTDLHYPIFISLCLLLISCCDIFLQARRQRRLPLTFIKKMITSGSIALLGICLFGWPLIISIVKRILSGESYRTSILTQNAFSLDVASLVLPDSIQTIWGKSIKAIREGLLIDGIEQMGYVGIVPIVLLIIGIWLYKRGSLTPGFWRWSALAFAFALLSFGPYLKLAGYQEYTVWDTTFKIPMPFHLLRALPFADFFRTPNRLQVMMLFCLAVAAAYSYQALLRYLPADKRKSMLLTLLVVIVMYLDIWPVPFPLTDARIPKTFSDPSAFANTTTLLDVPLGWLSGSLKIGSMDSRYQYYQTAHQKRIIAGYISRIPDAMIYYYPYRPGISLFMCPWDSEVWQGENLVATKVHETLAQLQVDGIVLHKDLLTDASQHKMQTYLEQTLQCTLKTDTESIMLYACERPE